MPFIRRDTTGSIVEAREAPTGEVIEFLEPDDPEIVRFMTRQGGAAQIREQLSVSDSDMVRVIEDVIDVLIRKGVIETADLPAAVHAKLARRRELRRTMGTLSRLIGED